MTTNQLNFKPIVSLTTDFGQSDGYVGAMQGVMLNICPTLNILTLSHDIPAQNIQAAAFVLYQAFDYYPTWTVHCVVVDPGVGSERRAVAVRTDRGTFVGPDNGVFSWVLGSSRILEAVSLTNPDYQLPDVSATFHGRDIFAPAAAHLANGTALANLGPPVSDLIHNKIGLDLASGKSRVIHIDHFGNLFLDITAHDIRDPGQVTFIAGSSHIRTLSRTFADVADGQLLAYVGSSRNHIEIAMRNGNAAQTLDLQLGDVVQVIQP